MESILLFNLELKKKSRLNLWSLSKENVNSLKIAFLESKIEIVERFH